MVTEPFIWYTSVDGAAVDGLSGFCVPVAVEPGLVSSGGAAVSQPARIPKAITSAMTSANRDFQFFITFSSNFIIFIINPLRIFRPFGACSPGKAPNVKERGQLRGYFNG